MSAQRQLLRPERTLERFNEYARKGEDPDFGRGSYAWSNRLVGDFDYPNPNLGPLDKPPYHGVKLVPVSVGVNSHGLKTDTNGQVVHVRGHSIAGLYAIGNSNVNSAPLGCVFATEIEPLWSRIIRWTIAKPRPVPERFLEK